MIAMLMQKRLNEGRIARNSKNPLCTSTKWRFGSRANGVARPDSVGENCWGIAAIITGCVASGGQSSCKKTCNFSLKSISEK